MFNWGCNIDGNIMNVVIDYANNLFFLYGQTKSKKIDFRECNLKDGVFSITIAPLNKPERKINFTFQNNILEWEDEADEFNVCLIGIVHPGFYIFGKEQNKQIKSPSQMNARGC